MHTTPQTRLHDLRMPPEDVHDERPTDTRKHRPPIIPHLRGEHGITNNLPTAAAATTAVVVVATLRVALGLDEQLGVGEHDAREDVDDDLLADGRVDRAAEDGVAAREARQKGVVAAFLAVGAPQE